MARILLRVVCVAAVVALAAVPQSAKAVLLLHDSFDYPTNAALVAAGWQDGGPGTPTVSNSYFFIHEGSNRMHMDAAFRPPTIPDQTTLRLGNAVVFRELGVTLTQDFTITAKVAIAGYSRSLQIGLGDANGAGYSLRWNAAQPNTNSGNGAFVIFGQSGWPVITPGEDNPVGTAQLSLTTATRTPPTSFALPEGTVPPNPEPLIYPSNAEFLGFTEIKLKWISSTGTLEAYQDNALIPDELAATPVVTGIDGGLFTGFTRLYIGGGTNSFVDSVRVETDQAVTPLTDAGDHDFDGDVDGRDFLVWQRGNSASPLSSGDLADWQNNFGSVASGAGGMALGNQVPEPGSIVLLVATVTSLGAMRRRRVR